MEGFFGLTLLEVSVHCDKEGMGKSSSHHGGQEAERGHLHCRL